MLPHEDLLAELLSCPSVTPDDAGCVDLISQFLESTPTYFNKNQVTNAYFEIGQGDDLFLFVGHTDVVPPGPVDSWSHSPFSYNQGDPVIARGIVDMKGAIWAFCSALKTHKSVLKGRVGILLTSDEEGDSVDGVAHVVKQWQEQSFRANWALVGEPTSFNHFGDYFKHARRGSYTFHLTFTGTQGHTAYRKQANNPTAALAKFLDDLPNLYQALPPHNDLCVFSINSSTHTSNVIPAHIDIGLNLRYHEEDVIHQCIQHFQKHTSSITRKPGAIPYRANPVNLAKHLQKAILDVTGHSATASMIGGTSDARYLPPIADELIEFGLCSTYAHQINEQAPVKDLQNVQKVYGQLLLSLLGK